MRARPKEPLPPHFSAPNVLFLKLYPALVSMLLSFAFAWQLTVDLDSRSSRQAKAGFADLSKRVK